MGCRLSCRVVGGSSAVREIAWRETSRSRDCDGWRWRCAMRFRGNVSAGHDAPSTATVRHMQRRSGGRPLVQTAKQTAGRPHGLASTSPVSRFASHPRAATAHESLGHAVERRDRPWPVRRMDTSRRERRARWRASSPKARPPAGSPDGLSHVFPLWSAVRRLCVRSRGEGQVAAATATVGGGGAQRVSAETCRPDTTRRQRQ
jgi:hypothetical protein